jgi:phosphate-selective porin
MSGNDVMDQKSPTHHPVVEKLSNERRRRVFGRQKKPHGLDEQTSSRWTVTCCCQMTAAGIRVEDRKGRVAAKVSGEETVTCHLWLSDDSVSSTGRQPQRRMVRLEGKKPRANPCNPPRG